jgi:uncharacterized membrane protein YgcG
MNTRHDTLAAIFRMILFGGCWWWWSCNGLWGDDEFQHYVQRNDRMTMTSGDAKEVNAVTHMLTPWPRGVNDRRIIADGAHMQRALERYRRGARPPDPMPPVSQPDDAFGEKLQPEKQGGGGGGGGNGGGGNGAGDGTGGGAASTAPSYPGQ